MTTATRPPKVARVGDTVALAILVLIGLAIARAIGQGQARQWFSAKLTNNAGAGSGGSAPAGFTTDSGGATAGSTTAGAAGYLQDPVGSAFGTSPAPASCFGNDRGDHVHAGLDINVPVGWPVAAPAAGTVTVATFASDTCGGTLTIDHGSGLATHYCHLSGILVGRGDHVYRGQVVARTGGRPGAFGAGNSAAPHLHFSVYKNGQAVNPAPLIGRTCG